MFGLIKVVFTSNIVDSKSLLIRPLE